jgi:2-(1,2-epoxy-1,2-dihydrophenyl)acetyl-CoA isomerase
VFSGRMFGAEEAQSWGLITKIVPDDQLMGEALALAKSFVDAPTLAFGAAKKMFDAATRMSLDEFMDLEGSLVPLMAQAEDFKEGTRAFIEKRAPKFTGY